MNTFSEIVAGLRLPVIQAPMFLVSGPAMVIAACRAGIIGSFPTQNVRSDPELAEWFGTIDAATGERGGCAPYAVNLIVHASYPRRDNDLEAVLRYRPRIVITALGSPRSVVDAIHAYGGIVLADVISVKSRVLSRRGTWVVVEAVSQGRGRHSRSVKKFEKLRLNSGSSR